MSNDVMSEDGLHPSLPRPAAGRIQGVPYRPVQFDADDLEAALRSAADWVEQTKAWLGEGLDVMGLLLSTSDEPDEPLFSLKLMCLEEDLDGTTLAASQSG